MILYFYSILLAVAFLALSGLVRNRWVLWIGLMVMIAGVHFIHLSDPPFLRMVMICSVLLVGMKGIVLTEWGGGLNWWRRFIFTFLWFGMEPTPFDAKQRKLSWKKDAVTGVVCLLVGLAAGIAVAHMNDAPLLLMFVPLSLAFHYGLLRLLTAFWRMQGIAVRPLFRNPLVCRGLDDFWSRRWNLSFSQMMARTVQRPVTKQFSKRMGVFAVFVVSGLLHELAITLPVQSGYGLPTLYFTMHGLVVLIEKDDWPLWLKRTLAITLVAAPLPLLFPEKFTQEVIVFTLNQLAIF